MTQAQFYNLIGAPRSWRTEPKEFEYMFLSRDTYSTCNKRVWAQDYSHGMCVYYVTVAGSGGGGGGGRAVGGLQ